MRTLLLPLLLFCAPAVAQVDSTVRETTPPKEWLGGLHIDGRSWHDLPPPGNMVNAGYFQVAAAKTHTARTWVLVLGGIATAILHNHNETVGQVVGGMTLGAGVYLDLRGNNSLKKAGLLQQSGYRIDERYELVPDSIGAEPNRLFVPRNWKP